MVRKYKSIIFLFVVITTFGSLLVVENSMETLSYAHAQTPGLDWTEPVNVSQSGSTIEPTMIVDQNGMVHVLWQDVVVGFIYSSFDGVEWSDPAQVEFPFELSTPQLHTGPNNTIHAFWINIEATANEGELRYSQVNASSFGNGSNWLSVVSRANPVVAFDAKIDATGQIHLAFIVPYNTGSLSDGLYYIRSADGFTWTSPQLLFSSPYMRSLTTNNAHVSISTTIGADGDPDVFISWDNRLRKRLHFMKSADGGNNWDPPMEVYSPENRSEAAVPHDIIVHGNHENIVMVWKVGQLEVLCTQYYSWSPDGGNTWSESDQMLETVFGCPQNNQFVSWRDDTSLLFTVVDEQAYLLAWDGVQWSEPQVQTSIISFTDPDTLNDVVYRCRQITLAAGDQLYVIGCDGNQNGDIWFSSRAIGEVDNWFPPPTAWNAPYNIFEEVTASVSGSLLSDFSGFNHLIWNQKNDPERNNPGSRLYYSRWNGDEWSNPALISNSNHASSEKPVMVEDAQNRLFVVWPGGPNGEIMISYASAPNANNPLEWTEATRVSTVPPTGRSADLLIDGTGTLFLTYAVPINESRGIYLTTSSDVGTTWSEPVQIFDGVAAQWDTLDNPEIARTTNGELHLIWERGTLAGNLSDESLYYAKSSDDGLTWTEPSLITNELVLQADILAVDERLIHIAWLADSAPRLTLSHQFSQDGGLTWNDPNTITGFEASTKGFRLTADISNRVHLLEITEQGTLDKILSHWSWETERWSLQDEYLLDQAVPIDIGSVDAQTSLNNRVSVIYSGGKLDTESGELVPNIFFTSRVYDLTSGIPTPLPELTPTPAQSPNLETGSIDQSPTPTAELILPELGNQENLPDSQPVGGSWAGLVIGIGAAVLIAGLGFAVIYGIKTFARR